MEQSENRSDPRLDSTSSRLLERLSESDPEAWRQFVRLYGPVVRYWIRRSGLDASSLSDVFQEVFLAVSQNIPKFQRKSGTGKFRAWLKTIIRNKANDHFRRQGKQPLAFGGSAAHQRFGELPGRIDGNSADAESDDHADDDALAEPEGTFLAQRTLQLVRAEFREKTWMSFWRTAVDGRTSKEVADELGISAVAVRKAKSRVLQRLREAIEGEEPAGSGS
ncbi:MAG: sigma-70 family RNA polymerase sigma factor [Pirellulaceae bacterium]|jgi:RNA polymerase sigma-70 factor (ECF subfamily)|nr:sigma-70 family RNA polymerase sigma factor [Pirellulaceae bacterium]